MGHSVVLRGTPWLRIVSHWYLVNLLEEIRISLKGFKLFRSSFLDGWVCWLVQRVSLTIIQITKESLAWYYAHILHQLYYKEWRSHEENSWLFVPWFIKGRWFFHDMIVESWVSLWNWDPMYVLLCVWIMCLDQKDVGRVWSNPNKLRYSSCVSTSWLCYDPAHKSW